MADQPILPSPDDIVGPAIDALVARRPKALRHINSGKGRWSHLVAIWRAQAALAIARLADEVRQRRLTTATGAGLLDLIASEFSTIASTEPTRARGELTLYRPTFAAGGGVIKVGTRFARAANPNAVPLPLEAAEYEAIAPCIVGPTQLTNITVQIQATREGPHANTVLDEDGSSNAIALSTPLFDRTIAPISCATAGGSNGLGDAALRQLAAASATGQWGPTLGAIVAGALLGTGVRHVATLENLATGRTQFYVTDESWGWSLRLQNEVTQRLHDTYEGFGCSILSGFVTNRFVRVEADVQLRSARFIADTTEIEERVRKALRSYFDDRPDWYLWRAAALRGVIARADRRILTCASVTVKDRAGNVLTEPVVTAASAAEHEGITHFYLADDAVTLNPLMPA